jgi:hypothetical protein
MILAALLGPAVAVASEPASLSMAQQYAINDSTRDVQRFEMTAFGTLVVEPDGRITEVELDMPDSTREIYRQAMLGWKCRPVEIDGRIVRAKAHFLLDATGQRVPGSDDIKLGIERLLFIDPPKGVEASGERQARNELRPPRYPMNPVREGYGARVDVLVKLDAEGRVVDVGVDRLSLGVNEIEQVGRAEAFARQFASATLRAARQWRFNDPAVIAEGAAVVPVNFTPPERSVRGWQPVIPVEVTALPWMALARGEAVAMTAAGQPSSAQFQLIDEVEGTTIN